jgi:choline dehydrogenase-like flavoprotein
MATVEQQPKFYYRALPVALRQAGLLIMIALLPVAMNGPSTFFRYLHQPPGSYIVYAVGAVLVGIALSRIPMVVRALGRIPAVELRGGTLLVRGWEDRRFTLSSQRPVRFRLDESRGRIVIEAHGQASAQIDMRDLDGPTSLVRFLERWVGQQQTVTDIRPE